MVASNRASETTERRRRVLLSAAGAILGASLPRLLFGIGMSIGLLEPSTFGFQAVGIAVGAAIGLLSGARAATTAHVLLCPLAVAARAVIVTFAIVVGGAAVIGRVTGGPPPGLGDLVVVALFGVPVAIGAWIVVTAPVALVATAILRLARKRPIAGGAVVIAVALASFAPLPPIDLAFTTNRPEAGPAHVTWTVANRSHDAVTVGGWSPEADGVSGWTEDVRPCFVTTGSSDEPPNWFLTVARGEDETWDAIPTPVVSAADAPGSDPSVWIDVATDGTATAVPRRSPPLPDELTANLCATGAP